jgi:hypothetical protein
VRLIHVSDFHARAKYQTDQEVVIDAFLEDVVGVVREAPIDFMIVSGDVAFSADPDEYRIATESLLLPLMDAAGIDDRRRLILAPGNHDVQRAKINEFEELGLRAKLNDISGVNALLDDPAALGRVTARMTDWQAFVRDFYGDDQGDEFGGLLRFHAVEIDGAQVGIAAYNSAWRSSGDEDQGYLLVGDRVIKAGAARAKDMALRIAVMHHPPAWLAEFDSRQLNLALEGTFHALLTGHLHEAEPVGIDRTGGGYLHSAAGALYGDGGRGYANSYTVLDVALAEQKIRAQFRVYQPTREKFDAGVSVAEGGRAVFSLPATASELVEASGGRFGLTPADYMEKREQAGQLIAVWAREQSVIAPVVEASHEYRSPVESLQLYVVEPFFQRVPHEELAVPRGGKPRQPLTTDEILREFNDRVLVISGDGGTGVTTALVWTLLHFADLDHSQFPLLLHAHTDVQAGQRAFDLACRRGLALAGLSVSAEAALPPMIVAVNDADKLVDKKLDRLGRFIQANTESRFILGCRPDNLERISRRLTAESVKFATIHVGPFGRRHLRSLVRKAVNSADEERVLAIVSAVAGNTFSGRAPFVAAALISLAAAEETLQNVTDNVAITRSYAELLLGRNDRFEDSRVQMTYRNREHILQRIASKMLVDGDAGIISRADLEQFLRDYFDSIGWQLPVSYVVDDLVRRWVLFEARAGEFAFRQKPMHAFFAAGHAMEDSVFREFILADSLRWSTVIEYIAGLPKNDEKLLRQLHAAMPDRPARGATFARESPPVVIDDVSDLPEDDGPEAPSGASPEELDDVFDPMLYGDPSFQLATPGEEADQTFAAFAWTRLVSNVLRSSELVENTELKKRIFGSLIERWGDAADGLATHLQRLIAEHTVGFRESVLAATGEGDGGRELNDDEIADLFSMMGIAIVLWGAIDSLASLKLDNALAPLKPGHPVWDDPAAALVATALHADAHAENWLRYAFQLLDDYGQLEAVRVGVLAMGVAMLNVARSRKEREEAERLFVRAVLRNTQFAHDHLRNLAEDSLRRRLRLWGPIYPALE